jgi:FkbM family methyltransferase
MSIGINIIKGAFKKTKQAFTNKYNQLGINWLQVRKLKNLPDKGFFETPFLNGNIKFNNRLEFLKCLEEIFLKEIYKTRFKTETPFILDCGANIGLSVLYFKTINPHAKIIAFEPDEINYNLLTSNITSMNLKDIEVKKEAVWKENTTIQFIEEGNVSSRIETGKSSNAAASIAKKKVKATRLRDYLITKVDFLKIDIEGAEYEVVNDIQDKLFLVDNLFIEYHGLFEENYKLESILEILSKNNFKYYLESIPVYETPFDRDKKSIFDIQQNIYAFRD